MELFSKRYIEGRYPPQGTINVHGKIVNIPSIYRGVGITAVFSARYDDVIRLVGSKRIKPARLSLSSALLNVTIFDFHESPVGPYKEMVLTVPVYNNPIINVPFIPLLFNKFSNKFGFHVIDIFQSTRIAVEHGNVLTGYPHNEKLVDVKFEYDQKVISASVFDEDGEILMLRASKSKKEKKVQNSYMTYYEKNERLHKIRMDIYARENKLIDCQIDVKSHQLVSVLKNIAISNHSVQSSYYPEIIEVNPVFNIEIQ